MGLLFGFRAGLWRSFYVGGMGKAQWGLTWCVQCHEILRFGYYPDLCSLVRGQAAEFSDLS